MRGRTAIGLVATVVIIATGSIAYATHPPIPSQPNVVRPIVRTAVAPPPEPTPQQLAADRAKLTPPASSLPIPTPPYSPNTPHPVDISTVAPITVSEAMRAANLTSRAGPFRVDSVWQISNRLQVISGFLSGAVQPAIITVAANGSPQLWTFPPIGAPGDAYIEGVKGSLVLVQQGFGYMVFNYKTDQIQRSDQNANPLPTAQQLQP